MYTPYINFFPFFIKIFDEIFGYVKLAFSYIWTYLWDFFPARLLLIGSIVFGMIYFFINLLNRSKVD